MRFCKIYPITGLDRPSEIRKLGFPDFLDSWYMNVLMLSTLPPRKYPGYSFVLEAQYGQKD